MKGSEGGKIQPKPPSPPVAKTDDMTLGELWNEIMIRQYLAGQLTAYDIAIQELAPGMKRNLDNLLAQIDAITKRIEYIADEMKKKENKDKQGGLQADLNAAMTERGKVQVQISTVQATMQSVLQRGMSFLQQANAFVTELGQIWSQMMQSMG